MTHPPVQIEPHRWNHLAFPLVLLVVVSCHTGSGPTSQEVLRRLLSLKATPQSQVDGEYRYVRQLSFPPDSRARRNVVVISIDTLRADHLNCYGYIRTLTSPQIDLFARDAVLFENCYIHSPGTLSSQMTILTGYYPTTHGITYRRKHELEAEMLNTNRPLAMPLGSYMPALSQKVFTLAEILKVHGFHTIGFHEGGYLSAPLGYALGFDRFVCTQSNAADPNSHKQTEGVKRTFLAAREWLRTSPRPFFLFFHTYEVHSPYIHEETAQAMGLQKGQRRYNSVCYDEGIRYTDRYVGALLTLLESEELLSDTVVVITSDHGEEFGDHYPIWNMGHGESQYQEQVRVPLLVYERTLAEKAGHSGRRRVTEDIQSVDIVPTILELVFGGEYAAALLATPELQRSGRSVVPLILSGSQTRPPVYLEDSYYGPERLGLIREGFKFVLKPFPDELIIPHSDEAISSELLKTPSRELFDLRNDPLERHNVIINHSRLAAEMEDEVWNIRRALEQQNTKLRGGRVQLDLDTIRVLKSLGYL
jgi:arylsulfatase A-like enzyme